MLILSTLCGGVIFNFFPPVWLHDWLLPPAPFCCGLSGKFLGEAQFYRGKIEFLVRPNFSGPTQIQQRVGKIEFLVTGLYFRSGSGRW